MLKKFILPYIVFVIYRILHMTWRIRYIEPPEMKKQLQEREPFLLAHWHGDESVLLSTIAKYRVATMVSKSDDGEMMNKLVSLVGGKTSRGSSNRGGASALKGLIRLVREGYNSSMAVDGPKGPVYKVKPGVFELSRILNIPIFTAGIACNKKITFSKAWNQTYLPYPFAKIVILWTGPRPSIGRNEDPRSSDLALSLEETLHSARQQAFKEIAGKTS